MKSLKVNIPEGFEIDKEKSTFEEIIFKPIKRELPKRWEELGTIKGFYIGPDSSVQSIGYSTNGMVPSIRKVFPTREEAEASVALAQLCQLRDIYNKGWKPNWENTDTKFVIYFAGKDINTITSEVLHRVLSFKTSELRDKFLKNFKDLIEKAKPLL